MKAFSVALALAMTLLAPAAQAAETDKPCPAALPAGSTCHAGRDDNGAYYWIAVPKAWNGRLVLHAHGGPRTQTPAPDDPVEDLERFSVMVREGYAWAGSTYRRGGYGVRMAAEDTENLRRIAWAKLGKPRLTILHGQSWGANVAAKAAELYGLDAEGRRNYDAVLLTSGVLAGGTRAYQFRADLRAVYQFYCDNHPAPGEPDYPLWQGLPADSRMSRQDLARRVETCTGIGKPAEQRTAEQRQRARDITRVIGIGEDELVAHLAWGTFLFRDLVQQRLEGRNPFDNSTVRYRGSRDDAALNRGVARFRADPAAVARLAYDSDLSGLIALPTLTLHAIDDPTADVGHEALYRDTVARAGRADLLVQTFTRERAHSKLSTPQYAAALEALRAWAEDGRKPTPRDIAALCEAAAPAYGETCRFDTAFAPVPSAR